jgi:hypothetical protein
MIQYWWKRIEEGAEGIRKVKDPLLSAAWQGSPLSHYPTM